MLRRYIIGLLIIAFSLLLTQGAEAADISDHGIGISPLRQEVIIDPSFTRPGSVLVTNSGKQPQSITLSAESFNVTNTTYDYSFRPDSDEAKWFLFETDKFTLQPNESRLVSYAINVPATAEPGGHYVAIFATNEPLEPSSDGVNPIERVASLTYITVSGDTSRIGRLDKLNVPAVTFGRAAWSATIQNIGDSHFRSRYTVGLQSIIGTTLKNTGDNRLILPDTIRLIEGDLPEPQVVGLYKYVFTVGLGDNPAAVQERWVVFIPPVQGLFLSLIIVSIVMFTVRLRRKR